MIAFSLSLYTHIVLTSRAFSDTTSHDHLFPASPHLNASDIILPLPQPAIMSATPHSTTPALRSQLEFFITGMAPVVSAPDSDCSICTESLMDDVVQILACQHNYHANCALAWFSSDARRSNSCPNCRRSLYERAAQIAPAPPIPVVRVADGAIEAPGAIRRALEQREARYDTGVVEEGELHPLTGHPINEVRGDDYEDRDDILSFPDEIDVEMLTAFDNHELPNLSAELQAWLNVPRSQEADVPPSGQAQFNRGFITAVDRTLQRRAQQDDHSMLELGPHGPSSDGLTKMFESMETDWVLRGYEGLDAWSTEDLYSAMRVLGMHPNRAHPLAPSGCRIRTLITMQISSLFSAVVYPGRYLPIKFQRRWLNTRQVRNKAQSCPPAYSQVHLASTAPRRDYSR
jgi:hypothetical protein